MKTFALSGLLALTAGALDTYSESLDLFQLPSNFYLSNFTFNFDLDSIESQRVDYMPLHFVQFARAVPGLESL